MKEKGCVAGQSGSRLRFFTGKSVGIQFLELGEFAELTNYPRKTKIRGRGILHHQLPSGVVGKKKSYIVVTCKRSFSESCTQTPTEVQAQVRPYQKI